MEKHGSNKAVGKNMHDAFWCERKVVRLNITIAVYCKTNIFGTIIISHKF